MVVDIFSGSDETLKVYDLGVVGWIIFVAMRGQHKPIYECNLESSLLTNFFIGKFFIVQIFGSDKKKLPLDKVSCFFHSSQLSQ